MIAVMSEREWVLSDNQKGIYYLQRLEPNTRCVASYLLCDVQ